MSTLRMLGKGFIDNIEMDVTELHVDRDSEVVWSHGPRLDPNWSHVDSRGHFHAFDATPEKFPTLLAETVEMPCNGSCGGVCEGEGYAVTKYTCRICSETIEPGLIHGDYSTTIPGRTSWELRVSTETPLQFDQDVSFRLTTNEADLFGIARVLGVTSVSNGRMTFALHGVSPLGRRKTGRVTP